MIIEDARFFRTERLLPERPVVQSSDMLPPWEREFRLRFYARRHDANVEAIRARRLADGLPDRSEVVIDSDRRPDPYRHLGRTVFGGLEEERKRWWQGRI